jgi:hypothetical protein
MMSGKVAVMDNAGVFSRLIDKSQVAGNLSPNALYGAFAVNAKRGIMNQIYSLVNGVADRIRYFGAKDWKTCGRSLHDVDKYLESSQPAYVIRAGYLDPNSGKVSEHNTLAALDFYPYPITSGQFPVNLFNQKSDPLISEVSSKGKGEGSVVLGRGSKVDPEITYVVSTNAKDQKVEISLSNMGISNKKSLDIKKHSGGYLLSTSYFFNKDLIEISGLVKTERPEVEANPSGEGYRLKGWATDGTAAYYPSDAQYSLDYDPTPHLFTIAELNAWFINENDHYAGKPLDTNLTYILGTNPEIVKNGFIDQNGKHVVSEDVDLQNSVLVEDNLVIHGLKKLSGNTYEDLTDKELRLIFSECVPADFVESLAIVISTRSDDPIILNLGESISFDLDGENETLLFDKDEFGYLQTSNTGYRFMEMNPDRFPDAASSAIATIFANGEGTWGNDIEVTISQQAFKFIEANGNNNIYVERSSDDTGLPILYRQGKKEDKWVESHDPKENTPEKFFSRFGEEDGPRIFEITVRDTATGVTEFYPHVSFSPYDVDGSGVSIYIENILKKSDLVTCIVNNNIENVGYTTPVSRENVWILPVAENNDEKTMGKIKYVFSETKKLGGGKEFNLNGRYVPPKVSGDIETIRSVAFQQALNKILDSYIKYDSYLAFNAGQEILNPDFANLIASSNGGQPRVLGLTSVSLGRATDQDKLPTDYAPDEENGPSGGVATPWVAKYDQWVLGTDSDAGQQIYTSPVGWIGKLIGLNAISGMLPYAPAGYRRGILHGAFGLSKTWEAKQRLGVTEYKWNPIKYDPTAGYVVWDELTSQPIQSALSDIHVILAYQAMRRGIEQTLKGFEFEFNDESTVNTMLNLLRGMAEGYVAQKFAEQIIVDAADNSYGTDQIRIRWNVRFKGVARTIVVDVIAYPSSKDLAVSMAG